MKQDKVSGGVVMQLRSSVTKSGGTQFFSLKSEKQKKKKKKKKNA